MKTNSRSASIGAELNNIVKKHRVYRDLSPRHAGFLYEKFVAHANYAYSNHLCNDYPPGTRLCFRRKDIYVLVEQVWKRSIYFRVFHEGVNGMNEIKEAALYCFWVLKFQPFYVDIDDYNMAELNVKMALYILILGAAYYAAEMNIRSAKDAIANNRSKTDFLVLNTEGPIIDALLYSFRFRDWSKEAIMDLCEGLIMTVELPVGWWKPDLNRVHSAADGQWKQDATKGDRK